MPWHYCYLLLEYFETFWIYHSFITVIETIRFEILSLLQTFNIFKLSQKHFELLVGFSMAVLDRAKFVFNWSQSFLFIIVKVLYLKRHFDKLPPKVICWWKSLILWRSDKEDKSLLRPLKSITISWKLKSVYSVQRKKEVSDSPALVDFAIGLENSVFNLPDGQVMFFEGIRKTEEL